MHKNETIQLIIKFLTGQCLIAILAIKHMYYKFLIITICRNIYVYSVCTYIYQTLAAVYTSEINSNLFAKQNAT